MLLLFLEGRKAVCVTPELGGTDTGSLLVDLSLQWSKYLVSLARSKLNGQWKRGGRAGVSPHVPSADVYLNPQSSRRLSSCLTEQEMARSCTASVGT